MKILILLITLLLTTSVQARSNPEEVSIDKNEKKVPLKENDFILKIKAAVGDAKATKVIDRAKTDNVIKSAMHLGSNGRIVIVYKGKLMFLDDYIDMCLENI